MDGLIIMGRLKVASLFSGCGGMDLGVQGGFNYLRKPYGKHNTQLVYANDHDPYVVSLYNSNFEHKAVVEDVKQIKSHEFPEHDILIGGFPCQSFSVVAQNPPRLGNKDDRGLLFFEMCRILREKKPAAFIAENVKGILSANKKMAFPLIIKEFEKSGYHVKYTVLNASDYGIPQKRERVIIVGFRDFEKHFKYLFPSPTTPENKVPLSKALMQSSKVPDKYFFSNKAVEGMLKVRHKMNKGRAQDISKPCNTISAHLSKVSLNSVDPVLKIGERYRRFTPREAARIQSFPDSFILNGPETKQYKAIGNAVPPVLMWHIMKSVLEVSR
jgi:DNA (cytosine-5)-methyltransferase 1